MGGLWSMLQSWTSLRLAGGNLSPYLHTREKVNIPIFTGKGSKMRTPSTLVQDDPASSDCSKSLIELRSGTQGLKEHDISFYSGVCMVVCAVFRTDLATLFAPTRCRAPHAFARQVAVYLAHIVGSKSYTEIGRIFGRDRTTAAHACRVIEDRRDDPVFDRLLELLENAVSVILATALHTSGRETQRSR